MVNMLKILMNATVVIRTLGWFSWMRPTACFTVTEARRLQQPEFDLQDS